MDAIVSVTRDWAIGRDGGLLVRNREDMRRFVSLTRGCTCIMGRKTYEGFPKGPLRGRKNVIVTRQAGYVPPRCEGLDEDTSVVVAGSPEEALRKTRHDAHVWLIGGASLYAALLSRCSSCYVTKHDVVAEGADAFFPALDGLETWVRTGSDGAGVTEAGVPYEFLRYERGPWVAPSAVVEGDVSLGSGSSVWHGAVIRGDLAPITIGPDSNVQDNAVIHVDEGFPVRVGRGVTIGHGAIIHGCEIGDNCVIGMGSIILNGARIGRDSIIGAGALVTQGKVVPGGTVWFGNPATQKRGMTPANIEANRMNARCYKDEAAERLARGSDAG